MPLHKFMSQLVESIPPGCLTVVDREKFKLIIELQSVNVEKATQVSVVMPVLKPFLFRVRRFSPVVREEGCQMTRILVDPDALAEKAVNLAHLLSTVKNIDATIGSHEVCLTYENFSAEDIFKLVLPEEASVSGYSHVGHIIHLNLHESQLPYKNLIAQVLLDKVPKCSTVINKSENIDGQFRNLAFELLAGKNEFVTRVKENRLTFELDYSKVYWNSRLSTERERLLDLFLPGDTVYDVFAGVGPLALAAASLKRCRAFSNDLNPSCFDFMRKNAKINKLTNVHCSSLDGSVFIADLAAADLKSRWLEILTFKNRPKFHFVMNLPAIASQFLGCFSNLMQDIETKEKILDVEPVIFVHFYYFAKKFTEDGKERDKENLRYEAELKIRDKICKFLAENLKTVDFVRSVAPNKDMMRATFTLSPVVLGLRDE